MKKYCTICNDHHLKSQFGSNERKKSAKKRMCKFARNRTILLRINPKTDKDVIILTKNISSALNVLNDLNIEYEIYLDVFRNNVRRALGKLTDYEGVHIGRLETVFSEQDEQMVNFKPKYVSFYEIEDGYRIDASLLITVDVITCILKKEL